MIALLSGGTGTPKLIQGLLEIIPQEELAIIVNTGEDIWNSGVYVTPDIDTVSYTLAGLVDDERWWGIKGDTFYGHEMLKRLGYTELLKLGDMDRAVNIFRTLLLNKGHTLSQATQKIADMLNIKAKVLPMSNESVQTIIKTNVGDMNFQEFWVARRAKDEVNGVIYKGAERAHPAPGVIKAIQNSEKVIIGPSNPISSIGPIIAIDEIRKALSKTKAKIVAVSPFIGMHAISGPAKKLMQSLNYEPTAFGVAKLYEKFLDFIVIDIKDECFKLKIKGLGIKVLMTDIVMKDLYTKKELARLLLEI